MKKLLIAALLATAFAQADFGDHVLVDNRHNAVGLAHGGAGRGAALAGV